MSAQVKHSGGLIDAVIELGFDDVKYFEGSITGTASGFTIDPPARRIIVNNKDENSDVFLRINDSPATTSVGFSPGDDIKIGPGCSFSMDFDILKEVSFITGGATVNIEGILGFKATKSC